LERNIHVLRSFWSYVKNIGICGRKTHQDDINCVG